MVSPCNKLTGSSANKKLCYALCHSKSCRLLRNCRNNQPTNQPQFYGHYTGQPALTSLCLHALADGNQHIQIREKTLEFSTPQQCIYTVSVPHHNCENKLYSKATKIEAMDHNVLVSNGLLKLKF